MKTIFEEKRVKRNLDKAVVSGVCAGIAEYFETKALWVRGAAVIGLFMAPVVVLASYFLAVILLPRRI